MMDRGSEYLGKGRSNGAKSPSNASNGHFSEESASDEEHGIASNIEPRALLMHWRALSFILVYPNFIKSSRFSLFAFSDVGMRVGADYQASVPDFDPGKMGAPTSW